MLTASVLPSAAPRPVDAGRIAARPRATCHRSSASSNHSRKLVPASAGAGYAVATGVPSASIGRRSRSWSRARRGREARRSLPCLLPSAAAAAATARP
eukprot:363836-Chlamydomonas_euryale.AAC.7